jgi:hypothetical protein
MMIEKHCPPGLAPVLVRARLSKVPLQRAYRTAAKGHKTLSFALATDYCQAFIEAQVTYSKPS